MFWLLEETGLLLQSASQMDIFLPYIPSRGLQIPPPPSFSLPSNSGEGGMDVLFNVNRLDVGLEYKPLGRMGGRGEPLQFGLFLLKAETERSLCVI